MNTRPSSALQIAVEMAERQRDSARHSLRDVLAAVAAAHEQMAQLKTYAGETEMRWGLRAGATVAPQVLFHHRHFMDRLEHAMELQTNVLVDHEKRVADSQSALLAAQLRLATLKKLVAKRQRERDLAEQRRDQKQTDERAQLAPRPQLEMQ